MSAEEQGGPAAATGATPAVPGPQRPPLDDALVIDPRDPLGLGDLPPVDDARPAADAGGGVAAGEPRGDEADEDEDADVEASTPDPQPREPDGDAAEALLDDEDDEGPQLRDREDDEGPQLRDREDDEGPQLRDREDDAPGPGHEALVPEHGAGATTAPAGADLGAHEAPGGTSHAPSGVPEPDADAVQPAGPVPVAHPGERSAWTRLAHAMRPRITTGQLLTAALCALLGLALVVQVRQTTDAQLGSLRQDDLVRLLDETTTRADELAAEAADLQRERDELLSGSDRQQAALDAARRNAATQGILTGRLPATGPGVRVTLHDGAPGIRPGTMLHVLEELRNAGAEAVQLNDMRVTASSAFTGSAGAVVLDGTMLTPPYRWLVIGDPDTIATALEIPGGAIATVRRDGGRGTVERVDRVDVTALRELPDPVHATPVPGDG